MSFQRVLGLLFLVILSSPIDAKTAVVADANTDGLKLKVPPKVAPKIAPLKYSQRTMTFSGQVMAENGDKYGYYFQFERKRHKFHTMSSLIDLQTKTVIFHEEEDEVIEHPLTKDWRVGRSFLKYVPITHTWLFGVKTKDKLGFNFKMDLLTENSQLQTRQTLSSGLLFAITQSNNINGHVVLSVKNKEQFITAHHAWLLQTWVISPPKAHKPVDAKIAKTRIIEGLLCRFDDGSGLYRMTLKEKNILRASIAGYKNSEGKSQIISQFLSLKPINKDHWVIDSAFPKLNIDLMPIPFGIAQPQSVIMGIIRGKQPGFCTVSHAVI